MLPDSRLFRLWLAFAATALLALFWRFNDLAFLAAHWHYPATMVVGAFVAGSTPEGGGAVAFPVLSVFFQIDRVLARDFSLMVQSIGMTSASLYILTRRGTRLAEFAPLLWWVPVGFAGFVFGMATLQGLRVPVIQALFLSLITAFSVCYWLGRHRGVHLAVALRSAADRAWTVAVLLAGGLCASLFGTGADILIYTLLVTRFALQEKRATEMSIVLMASLSILGYAWRGAVQQELTLYQVQTWLCAAPVVLVMAPLGAAVLRRVPAEWMLRFVVLLNLAQLAYFNLRAPSLEKAAWSALFCALLFAAFGWLMLRLGRRAAAGAAAAA